MGGRGSCDSLTQGSSVYPFWYLIEVDLFLCWPFVIGLFHFRFVPVESCVRRNFLGLSNTLLYVLAHSLYLYMCSQMVELLPYLGYGEQCC